MKFKLLLLWAAIAMPAFAQNQGGGITQPGAAQRSTVNPTTLSCTVGQSPSLLYNNGGTDSVYTAQGSPCAYALAPGGSTTVCGGAVGGTCGALVINGGAIGLVKAGTGGASTTPAVPNTDYLPPANPALTGTPTLNGTALGPYVTTPTATGDATFNVGSGVIAVGKIAGVAPGSYFAMPTVNGDGTLNGATGALAVTKIQAQSVTLSGNSLLFAQPNGIFEASRFGTSTTGIATALTSLGGVPGVVAADPTYAATELPPAAGDNLQGKALGYPAGTLTVDQRKGHWSNYCQDPVHFGTNNQTCAFNITSYTQPGAGGTHNYRETNFFDTFHGGNNTWFYRDYWASYAWPPIGIKTIYAHDVTNSNMWTNGEITTHNWQQNHWAQGDNVLFAAYGGGTIGQRNDGDENHHSFDMQMAENPIVVTGTVATGGLAATTLQVTLTGNSGTSAGGTTPPYVPPQGQGGYLLISTPTVVGTLSGTINAARQSADGGTDCTNGVSYTTASCIPPQLVVSGTSSGSVVPSTFLGTLSTQINPAATTPPTPGNVTFTVAALSGYALTSLSAGQYITISDAAAYEQTQITSVNTSTGVATAFANFAHEIGALVSMGGSTGTFIDLNAYDITSGMNVANTNGNYPTAVTNTVRHVFPVAGVKDSTHIYVWNHTDVQNGFPVAQWGANNSVNVTSASCSSNVVTVTLAMAPPYSWVLSSITFAGMTGGSGFNITATVASATSSTVLTYPSAGCSGTATGGTATFANDGFTLFKGSEVLSVYNPTTKAVDGYFQIEQNPWDWTTASVEETHGPNYSSSSKQNDTHTYWQVSKYQLNQLPQGEGITCLGLCDSFYTGWTISNQSTTSLYAGHGGFAAAPRALDIDGIHSQGVFMQYAPEVAPYMPPWYGGPPTPCAFCVGPNFLSNSIGATYYLFGAQGTNGWSGLLWDNLNQNLQWSNAGGTGFVSGHTALLGGVATAVGVATAGTSSTLAAGPIGVPTTDGTTNKNSNVFDVLGAFGDGTTLRTAGEQTIVSVGTGTVPAVTAAHSIVSTGTLSATQIESWTAQQFQFNGTLEAKGALQVGSAAQFQVNSSGIPTSPLTTPASSSATCTVGQFINDANFVYVCTATNTWKRVALGAF